MNRYRDRLHGDYARVGVRPALRVVIAVAVIALQCWALYAPEAPGAGLVTVPGGDKVVHALLFTAATWAVARSVAPVRRFPAGWVFAATALHAGVSELVQLALPHRTGSGWDLLADAVGILVGILAWNAERRRLRAVTVAREGTGH